MIKITVISVGKLKEKYFADAIEEYKTRLLRYASVNCIELKDEAVPENLKETEKDLILKKEAERVKEKIPKGAYIISLCVEGKNISSEEFASLIKEKTLDGISHIVFIIGGSVGLSDEIKALSDLKLSFSKMTFPHRLMKVILFEQIYRAFTIQEGKTYHK